MIDMKYTVQIAEDCFWFQEPVWKDLTLSETRLNMLLWETDFVGAHETQRRIHIKFQIEQQAIDFIQKEESIGDKYYPLRSYKIRKEYENDSDITTG